MPSKTLVIIPAYNEESNIVAVVNDLNTRFPDVDYVVVNDSSSDNTLKLLQDNHFNYLDLPVNLGIGGGVQAGYIYAYEYGYDIAVQMDGDGQHSAEELMKIVKPIELNEADMVIGSRFIDKNGFQSSQMRRIGISFLSKLIYFCSKEKVLDCTSGFRAVNKRFIEIFSRDYAQDYPEPEAIITVGKYGGKVKEVPVSMKERMGGKSSISGLKSIYYMIKVTLAIIIQRLR